MNGSHVPGIHDRGHAGIEQRVQILLVSRGCQDRRHSIPPSRCTCMSARPGQRGSPLAVDTLAPRRERVPSDGGPAASMRSTLEHDACHASIGAPPLPSMIRTSVIATRPRRRSRSERVPTTETIRPNSAHRHARTAADGPATADFACMNLDAAFALPSLMTSRHWQCRAEPAQGDGIARAARVRCLYRLLQSTSMSEADRPSTREALEALLRG